MKKKTKKFKIIILMLAGLTLWPRKKTQARFTGERFCRGLAGAY